MWVVASMQLYQSNHPLATRYLWQVSTTNPHAQRQLCRSTVKDAFLAARVSLEQQLGPQVRDWTDLQVRGPSLALSLC